LSVLSKTLLALAAGVLVSSVEDRQAKGVPGPLACLSFLKRSRPWRWQLAQDRLLACLSCLKSFARGLRRRRAKKNALERGRFHLQQIVVNY
tara:strand:+ start:190 stop:465 length:276 start_codon:yes stop_codon:yes gene_type:complete